MSLINSREILLERAITFKCADLEGIRVAVRTPPPSAKFITRPPPLWTKFLDPRMTHDENIVRKIYVRIYHLIKIFT